MFARIGNNMCKKPLELLSPAKDKKCAIAAINYGADAVYIGAFGFGARKGAPNSLKDIKEVADYAHKFFARVYVTINTILDDNELKQVQKLLYDLYDIGVDGIIVQDFGIFKLDIPPFLISASTQCDIRDLNKVKFFENLGLDRAILARELSLDEIKNICRNSKIEIETFIHGALCVSYSGQCYLSRAIGSRSANRGECAQPCRKKYTLVDSKGKIYAENKHLLSLKDFCAAKYIDTLIDSGVVSFKIEGRLKDENYVKNVTAFYNLALKDAPRISSGKVFYDFIPDVKKSFNRSFTSYFLNKGEDNEIFSFEPSAASAQYIGVVCGIKNNCFQVKTNIKINPQDGLCFIKDGNTCGMLVNRIESTKGGVWVYPNNMPAVSRGTKIFRNSDAEFEKKLKNSATKRRIALKLKVYSNKIEALDEDMVSAVVEFHSSVEAKNRESFRKVFREQLEKCGNSDYYIEQIYFENDAAFGFLRVSEINALRRELFEKITKLRLKKYEKLRTARKKKKITPAAFPLKNNDYRLNIHNNSAYEFYEECGVKPFEYSYETKKVCSAELMRTKHCLRRAFNMCIKNKTKPADKIRELFLLDEKGRKFRLEFDCKNCEMIIKEY